MDFIPGLGLVTDHHAPSDRNEQAEDYAEHAVIAPSVIEYRVDRHPKAPQMQRAKMMS